MFHAWKIRRERGGSGARASVGDKMLLLTDHTVDKLMLPHQKQDLEKIVVQYPHIRGLTIHSHDGRTYVPMEARVGNPMVPIAVRTNLGRTVYGP